MQSCRVPTLLSNSPIGEDVAQQIQRHLRYEYSGQTYSAGSGSGSGSGEAGLRKMENSQTNKSYIVDEAGYKNKAKQWENTNGPYKLC